MPQTLEQLRERFAIPELVSFDAGHNGLARIRVNHPEASADFYVHGAHATHFKPRGHDPVLFVSEKSWFEPGKPIRGGVPVCFPWFGLKSDDPQAPAHGFVRLTDWEVESVDKEKNGAVTIMLGFASNKETRKLWNYDFELKHRITIDKGLALSLEMRNAGGSDLLFEEALHTYFHVSDVRKVRVLGLESLKYFSKVEGGEKPAEKKPIVVDRETDRVYDKAAGSCVIEDPGLKRRIHVDKTSSRTTVVWNPWIAKAKAMPDFGDDEWPRMICVETANARGDAVMLQPGGRHTMTATIRVERM